MTIKKIRIVTLDEKKEPRVLTQHAVAKSTPGAIVTIAKDVAYNAHVTQTNPRSRIRRVIRKVIKHFSRLHKK